MSQYSTSSTSDGSHRTRLASAGSGIHIPVSVARDFNAADKARTHATVKALRSK